MQSVRFTRVLNSSLNNLKKPINFNRFRYYSSTFTKTRTGSFNKWLLAPVAGGLLYYSFSTVSPAVVSNDAPASGLSPKDFSSFEVKEVITLSHNVKKIVLKLPSNARVLGLPTCSCVLIRAPDAGSPDGFAVRPYTPIESSKNDGTFELIIKTYPGGKLSNFLCSRKPGDAVEMKGPFTKLPYQANEFNEIGLIAGGSGLTPMLQLVREVAANPDDKTKLTFIFANVGKEDIILKKELDALAKSRCGQIKMVYTLNNAPFFWCGEKGNVSAEMIKKYMPQPSTPKSKILVCGPPGMMQAISGDKSPDRSQGPIGGILKDLGYTEQNVFKF